MSAISWTAGHWTTEPAHVDERGGDLHVTAVEGSDAWRVTSYGFVHDTEHALLAPFPQETAMEVEFTAAFSEQFDQAGIFVRASDQHWVKAGVEYADGACQLGAVVTDGVSDWSLAPVSDWVGKRLRVRVSRSGNALTVRAGVVDGADGAGATGAAELQLVRVIPLDPELEVEAGPLVCAPTRPGLTVPFHSWQLVEPDASLHP